MFSRGKRNVKPWVEMNEARLGDIDNKGAACDARDVQVLFGSGFFTKLAASFVKNAKSPGFAKTQHFL
jgi:hypothetical protein